MVKCKNCEKEFENDRQLHAHIKAHKLKVADYYHQYFERRDKYSGDLINFKTKEQYFSSDFNDRRNLKKWLDSAPVSEAKKYCYEILKERKEKKDLEYSLSQVELRTLMTPPISYYNKFFGDYYKVCKHIGFENKYEKITKEIPFYPNLYKGRSIVVDTRETKPLEISDFPTIKKALNYGDYSIDEKCFIERKSLPDLIGTMSGGYDRFRYEIERAESDGANLVVLVENDLASSLVFHKLKRTFKKGVKTNPSHIFHNIRECIQEYPNIQFLFVKDRDESVRVLKRILFSNGEYSKYDLQYAYDNKLI